MTDAEIIERFDTDWNITIEELARLEERSESYVNRLLREEDNDDEG